MSILTPEHSEWRYKRLWSAVIDSCVYEQLNSGQPALLASVAAASVVNIIKICFQKLHCLLPSRTS